MALATVSETHDERSETVASVAFHSCEARLHDSASLSRPFLSPAW